MQTENILRAGDIGSVFAPSPVLTGIKELGQDGVLSETVLRVEGARVVYANYKLLKHDFPQLKNAVLEKRYPSIRALKGISKQRALRTKIDEWLLRNTAFISQSQARQSIVNTTIPTTSEKVRAFRPPLYGRALVFSINENEKWLSPSKTPSFENRLIDVKGIGVAPDVKPAAEVHRTGLIPVGEILYELVMQELFQRIFIHSKSAVQTLPVYGIIDLGFNEIDGKISKNPAGLMLRRAHRRPENPGGLYPYNSSGQRVQLEVELLLRKYGITSTDNGTTVKVWRENGRFQVKYGKHLVDYLNSRQLAEIEKVSYYEEKMGQLSFDGINIQHTREIDLNPTRTTMVDFQAYRIKKNFENPLLSLVSDKLLLWGGSVWPDYKSFVQPDPELQIPVDLLGEIVSTLGYNAGPGDAYSKINMLCFGLADDFRAGKINSEMLKNKLCLYFAMLTKHLKPG